MSYTTARHHGAISMFWPQFQWTPGGLRFWLCAVCFPQKIMEHKNQSEHVEVLQSTLFRVLVSLSGFW